MLSISPKDVEVNFVKLGLFTLEEVTIKAIEYELIEQSKRTIEWPISIGIDSIIDSMKKFMENNGISTLITSDGTRRKIYTCTDIREDVHNTMIDHFDRDAKWKCSISHFHTELYNRFYDITPRI